MKSVHYAKKAMLFHKKRICDNPQNCPEFTAYLAYQQMFYMLRNEIREKKGRKALIKW